MALKLNIGNPNTGKTHSEELDDEQSKALSGKRIGDTVSGNQIGFPGYEFEVTGGSDKSGFPMRRDVQGTERKRVLISEGTGLKDKTKGLRKKRTVAGNTISSKTAQVNLKVLEEGDQPLGEEPAEETEASGEADEETEEKEEAEEDKESEEQGSEETEEEDGSEDAEEASEETSEEASEAPTRSELDNMTKDEMKEYADSEFGIELSTNDLKDEMIEQFLEEVQ